MMPKRASASCARTDFETRARRRSSRQRWQCADDLGQDLRGGEVDGDDAAGFQHDEADRLAAPRDDVQHALLEA